MKQKVLISGLSLLLTFSLAGCGGQQAQQEPQEPKQEVQQTEPIMTSDNAPEQLSNDREQQELSGDELIEYFQVVYGTSDGLNYLKTLEEKIDFEIEVLEVRAENENKLLPSDYADQYRAWRPVPVEEDPADNQTETSGENQQQTKPSDKGQQQTQQPQQGQSGGQQSEPSGSTQTQQPSQPSGGAYDPYDGYGSYEAYIDHICEVLPHRTREEIIQMFPDPATGEAGPSTANDMEKGLLSG